ncbi:MAG TPA: hypothetical protein DCQ83_03015 [Fibrobacteres bacterium]|jgi:hypothetical protein|nr:hypothetical protein [Fibrobacterota bacterium]
MRQLFILLAAIFLSSCFESPEELDVSGPVPSDTTIVVGGTLTLKVYAHCGGPCGTFYYQWKKDGVDLVDGGTDHNSSMYGSAGPELVLTNIQQADSGSYTCLVNYPEIPDTKLSDVSHLRVNAPPVSAKKAHR